MSSGSKKFSGPRRARWIVSFLLALTSTLGLATAQPASALSHTLKVYATAPSYPVHYTGADPLGYFGEQCVSYAAWWELHHGHEINHAGPASSWKTWALSKHDKVDHAPTVGAVAWWGHHVAVIDYVGRVWIRVREFNFLHSRRFDTRWIKRGSRQFPLYILHIKQNVSLK